MKPADFAFPVQPIVVQKSPLKIQELCGEAYDIQAIKRQIDVLQNQAFLQAIAGSLSSANQIAAYVTAGSSHGYVFQTAIVQVAQHYLQVYRWSEANPLVTKQLLQGSIQWRKVLTCMGQHGSTPDDELVSRNPDDRMGRWITLYGVFQQECQWAKIYSGSDRLPVHRLHRLMAELIDRSIRLPPPDQRPIVWFVGFSPIVNHLLRASFAESSYQLNQRYQLEIYSDLQNVWSSLKAKIPCNGMVIYADKPGFELIQAMEQDSLLKAVPVILAGSRLSHMPWNCTPTKPTYPTWMKEMAETFWQQQRYLQMPWLEEDLASALQGMLQQ